MSALYDKNVVFSINIFFLYFFFKEMIKIYIFILQLSHNSDVVVSTNL
jgi:hypothetical protein